MAKVDILLSTYNGEAFLQSQLDSITSQSFADWHLIVRDDGSADATAEITHQFQADNPERVCMLESHGENLGVIKSFGTLMQNSSADYVMFCDQDDVWLPSKIGETLSAIEDTEAAHGRRMPLLAHCDLTIVDEQLQPLAQSMWKYQHLSGQANKTLQRLLVQNYVTGCTVMINRALCDKVSIPKEAVMHDWYLAIAAAAMGRIVAIPKPLILYRQHASNAVGGQRYSLAGLREKGVAAARRAIEATYIQAASFADNVHGELPEEAMAVLNEYVQLQQDSFWQKRSRIIRNGFWKSGLFRNIGMLLIT